MDAEDDQAGPDRVRTGGERWEEGMGQGWQARNAAIVAVGPTGRRHMGRVAFDGARRAAMTDRRRQIDCVSGAGARRRRERQNAIEQDVEHRGDRTV